MRGSGRGRGLAGLVVNSARRGASVAGPALCGASVAGPALCGASVAGPPLCGASVAGPRPAAARPLRLRPSRIQPCRSLPFLRVAFFAILVLSRLSHFRKRNRALLRFLFAIARPRYSSNSAMTSAFDVVPNLAYR